MTMAQSSGQIIILNGTSSSGKSSVAKELQSILSGYTLHTGIDHFVEMLPEDFVVLSDGTNPAAVEGLLWVTTDAGKRVTEFRFGMRYACQLPRRMCQRYPAIDARDAKPEGIEFPEAHLFEH